MFNFKKYRTLSFVLVLFCCLSVLFGCFQSVAPKSDDASQAIGTATLTIVGYNGAANLPSTEVTVTDGMTCMDILNMSGFTIIKSNGMVSSIDGLSYGIDGYPESGWVFTQNGEYQMLGADECLVKDKDSIVWSYILSFDLIEF